MRRLYATSLFWKYLHMSDLSIMSPGTTMRLALFQPDIPQNTGTILRLSACLGVAVDVIEPCGFPLSHKSLKRAGMDYLDHVDLTLHPGWAPFEAKIRTEERRVILLTTKASQPHTEVNYTEKDIILLGRESAGVPEEVHKRADLRIQIPMKPEVRSLNVAISASIVLAEALRQTNGFPTT
jgi:tRNA (cytidine/uridine-2'-O-)-methyltransferase